IAKEMVVREAHPEHTQDRIELPSDEEDERWEEKDPAGRAACEDADSPGRDSRTETQCGSGSHPNVLLVPKRGLQRWRLAPFHPLREFSRFVLPGPGPRRTRLAWPPW